MSDTDSRALWDRKYEEGLPSLTTPDPYFVSAYERLVDRSFPNAGIALDLAAGLGRHALWLADRGWQVSAVDISEVAMGKLSQAACQFDHKINLDIIDVAKYEFGSARFDLILLAGPVGKVVRKVGLEYDSDLLVIGRGVMHENFGRLRTESYGIIRESPCPVLSL